MFITGGPDKRIKDPFLRRLYYYMFMIPILTLMIAPMVYGLLYPIFVGDSGGIKSLGIFTLAMASGFIITYILAIKRGGMPWSTTPR
jgi:hypothetical protein